MHELDSFILAYVFAKLRSTYYQEILDECCEKKMTFIRIYLNKK